MCLHAEIDKPAIQEENRNLELCDIEGAPLEGLALADSEELCGNEVEHTVAWRDGADVARHAGRPVRLRDVDLYSICFAP